MGLLKSLFGQPPADYSKLIRSIASMGGKGISQTKFEVLSKYFSQNAQVLRSNSDMLLAKFDTDGGTYDVLIERERAGGRDTGRTIVSASTETPVNWNDPKIGDALANAYSPFIKSRKDAENVAHAIIFHGRSQFIYDSKSGGQLVQGAQSSAVIPSALNAFINSFPDDYSFKVNHDVLTLTEQLTRDAGETEIQIQVIYSIADAIVRAHRLP